jgi:hypothetical protein
LTRRTKREQAHHLINLASSDGLDLKTHALAGRIVWKFIVVQTKDTLDLVVGPVAHFRYHAGLVDRYCCDRQISALRSGKSGRVEVYDRLVRVLGGGHFRVDPRSRSVTFRGQSTAYGPYESDTVGKIAGTSAFFNGYTLIVD